jgi:ribosomal protein L10
MAVNKTKKAEILSLLEQELQKANSIAFTTNSKLTVEEISSIRRDLRKVNSKLILAKKTLIKIAFKKIYNIDLQDEILIWQIAVLLSFWDNIVPLNIINKYINEFKKDKKIRLVWAYFDNNLINENEVCIIASLQSKEILFAKLLWSMKSPISALARFMEAAKKELESKSLNSLNMLQLKSNNVKVDEIKEEVSHKEIQKEDSESEIVSDNQNQSDINLEEEKSDTIEDSNKNVNKKAKK